MKRKRIDGDEQSLFSRYWRHREFWQPGERRKIRRRVAKRERQEGRREVAAELARAVATTGRCPACAANDDCPLHYTAEDTQ